MSRILLCTKLYSGACLDLLGMRIQHAVCVYWILHLNSRCEIISQCAWGGETGLERRNSPLSPAPLPFAPAMQFSTC